MGVVAPLVEAETLAWAVALVAVVKTLAPRLNNPLQPDLSSESENSKMICDQWRRRLENNRSVSSLCNKISHLHLEKKGSGQVRSLECKWWGEVA